MKFINYCLYSLLGGLLASVGLTLGIWQTWAIIAAVTIIDVLSHMNALKGKA